MAAAPHASTAGAVATSASGVGQRARPGRMVWITAAWGACFIAIEWGLRDAPLLWYAALRAVLAGAVLVALGSAQRRTPPSMARDWAWIAGLGLTNVTLAFVAMFAGVAGGTTGTASVLANAQPLLILLPAWWLYGERPSASTSLALVAGFAGLVLVALPGGGGSGAALSLLSAVAVTAGTLMSRRLANVDAVLFTGWHLLIGGAVRVGLATVVEGAPAIAWTPRFVLSLLFLAVAGTAGTTVAWFVEVRRSRFDKLTAWTFLTPVFGVTLAVAVLGERPAGWTGAGLVLVLIAMWVVLRPAAAPRPTVPGQGVNRTAAAPGRGRPPWRGRR